MNIPLITEAIKVTAFKEGGELVVKDNIGFAINSKPGFNYSDSSFTDLLGNAYPTIDKVYVDILAYHKPYKNLDDNLIGNELEVKRTSNFLLESISNPNDATFEYLNIANTFDIINSPDGWVEIFMYAFDVDNSTSLYYYDSGDNVIKRSEDDSVITLKEVHEINTASANYSSWTSKDYLKFQSTLESIKEMSSKFFTLSFESKKEATKLLPHINKLNVLLKSAIEEFYGEKAYIGGSIKMEFIQDYIEQNNLSNLDAFLNEY